MPTGLILPSAASFAAKDRPTLVALAGEFGSEKPVRIHVRVGARRSRTIELRLRRQTCAASVAAGYMRVDTREGKRSRTEFTVRESFDGFLLLECRPLTGRAPQIRAHLKHLRLPLVGDDLYGGAPLWLSTLKPEYRLKPGKSEQPLISRAALHAEQLILRHPKADASSRGSEGENGSVRMRRCGQRPGRGRQISAPLRGASSQHQIITAT